jgi:hypothetical protein
LSFTVVCSHALFPGNGKPECNEPFDMWSDSGGNGKLVASHLNSDKRFCFHFILESRTPMSNVLKISAA